MPNLKKEEAVRDIAEQIKGAGAMWIVDYRGLTVKQSEELRKSIREAGAGIKVLKNTLTKRALSELNLPTMDEYLQGPSAFVFTTENDPVSGAKAIKDFSKNNSDLVIKGGLMGGNVYTPEEVLAIAELPSRDQIIGQIAGAIAGVARGLAVSINGVSRGLAQATNAVAEQKGAA